MIYSSINSLFEEPASAASAAPSFHAGYLKKLLDVASTELLSHSKWHVQGIGLAVIKVSRSVCIPSTTKLTHACLSFTGIPREVPLLINHLLIERGGVCYSHSEIVPQPLRKPSARGER